MRPFLVIAVWIVFVGGLTGYMHTREEASAVQEFRQTVAAGHFAVEVTASFAVEPDPFALNVETKKKKPALVLKVNGQEALSITERLDAGAPVVVEKVGGIVEGINELYVEANPPIESVGRVHAVRVRVLKDGRPLAQESLWSEPGNRIASTFKIKVGGSGPAQEDDHGR